MRKVTNKEGKAYEEIQKMQDELLSEYDLTSLKIRKMGAKRKSFEETIIKLDPDVAEMFPKRISDIKSA